MLSSLATTSDLETQHTMY